MQEAENDDAYDEEREDWDGDGEGDDCAIMTACWGRSGWIYRVDVATVGYDGRVALQSDHLSLSWACLFKCEEGI